MHNRVRRSLLGAWIQGADEAGRVPGKIQSICNGKCAPMTMQGLATPREKSPAQKQWRGECRKVFRRQRPQQQKSHAPSKRLPLPASGSGGDECSLPCVDRRGLLEEGAQDV